jgi:hypothetical protein
MLPCRRACAGLIVLAVLSGCGHTPEPPAGTGAREAAQGYLEGLLRQDWQQAYDALHSDSKKRVSLQAFTRRAQAYRKRIGFEPEELHLQSCAEKETEAIVRVVWTGPAGSRQRRYRDAVILRRESDGWGVVVLESFGR